jgi:hypothetical protein
MTPDTRLSLVNPETKQPNPAEVFLEQEIRPLLGDEITNFWKSQTDKWTQQFVQQKLNVLMDRVGNIPETKAATDKEADPTIKFKLEHWMLAGNIHVAGNLTIASAAEAISRTNNPEEIQTLLKTMGGAQARINWEIKHNHHLDELNRVFNFRRENGYDTSFVEAQIDAENQYYKSPLQQLNFLQKSQHSFITTQNKVLETNPNKFKKHIKAKQDEAFSTYNTLTKTAQTLIGRDDRGYFDVNLYLGPWSQLGTVEESLRNGHEPKGVSVVFYRINHETGEKEFFLCYGKRDAFSRTHHLTPTWQTSMTRISQGNHPGQDYNPTLDSLKDAFQQAGTTNGVEISYLDLNANRNEKSPIAVATIDFESYTPDQQAQLLTILEKENKGIRHAWITEETLIKLGRIGLVDRDGVPAPAINGFLGIAVGRRHPKEIQTENLNRRTLSVMEQLYSENPEGFKALETGAQKLIESSETRAEGVLLLALIQTVLTQVGEHKRIQSQFPHLPQQLRISS